jgi:ankyrin repeat protein
MLRKKIDPHAHELLFDAADQGNTDAVRTLLAQSADINYQRTSESLTPLMIASYRGNLDTVRVLLEYGAVIDIKQKVGQVSFTALDQADIGHQKKVVKLIKEHITEQQTWEKRKKEVGSFFSGIPQKPRSHFSLPFFKSKEKKPVYNPKDLVDIINAYAEPVGMAHTRKS